ncbi:SIMPL domain-containing protein [Aliiglaciecola sp. CAU 1673]|uniref:SIMPL domain-containing protein n=1 Tax=Aliiglaciecola sp. CAU 1673 TaxID=3032595 RepID=UPI0023D9D863|nr:SIMPL domain-containing protein [Aliiglaciecola sp. CAU 1673]MDF2177540.1 SIMPL domain-containing protein [Aliiglaciecola sp. CAU 1673]
MKGWIASLFLILSFAVQAEGNHISVIGQASVSRQPDLFQFSVYIEEKGEVVSKLNTAVSDATSKMVEFLTEQGIATKDIQSMQVQLHPWYEHSEAGMKQRGFSLSRQIQVSLRDFTVYDRILDGVMRLCASRIDGFRHGFENEQQLYLSALEFAVKDAEMRAAKLAYTLGAKIGKVMSVNELSRYQPMPIQMEGAKMLRDASPSLPGQVSVDVQVEVKFELLQ